MRLFTMMVVLVFRVAVYCDIEVKIANGNLKGKILKSRGGRSYYSFTGIPFAKPPIGHLRFEVGLGGGKTNSNYYIHSIQ